MRLSLCVIARDEAENLPRCLASAREVVDEIVVVDTGSRDGTPDVARAAGARVAVHDWNGSFADARNRSLELATGDWILVLDADEALHPDDRPGVRPLLAGPAEGYYFSVLSFLGRSPADGVLRDARLCLFRRRPEYRYERALHEDVTASILRARPDALLVHAPVRVLHYGYTDAALARTSKARRNQAILEEALARSPGDPFLLYALAAEAMAAGDFATALKLLAEAEGRSAPDAPWRPDAVKKRAACLIELGRLREAVQVLARGKERFPDFTDLVFLLGTVHARLGDREAAARCFRDCLGLGEAPPQYQSWEGVGSYRAQAALGALAEAGGDAASALEWYGRAVACRPDFAPAFGRLCRLLARRPSARAFLWVRDRFDLGHAPTVLALSRGVAAAGAPGLACRLLRSALEDAGAGPEPFAALGRLRVELGGTVRRAATPGRRAPTPPAGPPAGHGRP